MEATEPFPGELFRLPMPDAMIGEMPDLTDSALRSLLGLIRLSFRFDPNKGPGGQWLCPERTFSRAEIEEQSGLSGQGVRNGLEELEERGYVTTSRSGRSYEHALEVGVPEKCFTYVPTALLDEAASLSGTELRLVIATLRATWGWTTNPTEDPSTERRQAPRHEASGHKLTRQLEHKRWAQLPTSALARLTGRSETAVKAATRRLNGTWLQRRRPTSGAYYYRFRTDVLTSEALTSPIGSEKKSSAGRRPTGRPHLTVRVKARAVVSMGIPNDLAPDRQQSDPPRRGTIESSTERPAQHRGDSERDNASQRKAAGSNESSALLGPTPPPSGSRQRTSSKPTESPRPNRKSSQENSHRGSFKRGNSPRGRQGRKSNQTGRADLTGFSAQKRELGQKLSDVGVWPRRIPALLGRFSAERIEANLRLCHERGPQVENTGAWLAKAITEGYALPSAQVDPNTVACDSLDGDSLEDDPPQDRDSQNESSHESLQELPSSQRSSSLPALEHRKKVTDAEKEAYLRRGLAAAEDFHKFREASGSGEKQHMYFDPEKGGPALKGKPGGRLW